ncbi:MAG: hypothetical protein J0H20_05910 [Rhizobiales bacterium]|nr:hypothetical protein [Hyphomicrobiales bacterium]
MSATTFDLASLDFDAIARRSDQARTQRVVMFAITAILALAWVTPFYYLAISIFKSNAEYGMGSPLALPSRCWRMSPRPGPRPRWARAC